jgi:sugar phosphate isomerase/epimerase
LSALKADDACKTASAILDEGFEGLVLEAPLHHDVWNALRELLPRNSVRAIRLFLPYPRALRPEAPSPFVAAAGSREERRAALAQAQKSLEAADRLGAPLVLIPMTRLDIPGLSPDYMAPTDSIEGETLRLRSTDEEVRTRMDSLLLLLSFLLERAERYATTICLTPGNRSGELPLTPETLACLEEFRGAPLGLWLDTCRLPGEFLRVPRIADTAGQASGLELFDKVEGASVSDETPEGAPCSPGEGAVPWDLITSSLRSLPLWCVNTPASDGLAEGLRFLGGLDEEREAPGELLDG